MARLRLLARSALTGLAIAAMLAGCTLVTAHPFDHSVRMSGGWSRLPVGPLSERHAALGVALDGRFLVLGGLAGPPCPPDAACTAPDGPALRNGAAFDPDSGKWAPIEP